MSVIKIEPHQPATIHMGGYEFHGRVHQIEDRGLWVWCPFGGRVYRDHELGEHYGPISTAALDGRQYGSCEDD